MSGIEHWLLTRAQRGNPASSLAAWCAGNRVEPLVHGAAYFDRLVTEVEALGRDDHLFFTDWRGDPDELMRPGGPTIGSLLCTAAERGVVVKGLVWRSHLDKLQFSEEENQHLGEEIEEAGGEVLLDQRVRLGGSHHQKLVVLRHPHAPERDVAFVGGIDLCHSRRDDASHEGDPQPIEMSARYGPNPPWHDVQLALHGPVVGAVDTTFRERWNDPAPPAGCRGSRPTHHRVDRMSCRCCAPIPRRVVSTISRRTANAASRAATARRSGGPGG